MLLTTVIGGTTFARAAHVKTGYAPVDGLKIYYEIRGEVIFAKRPLVLLHGGDPTIGTSFGTVINTLSKNRQVIAFEQQGHGHTADVLDRPFTFEQSADDAAALLALLEVNQADFLGYSNGGSIALQIAIRHPEVVGKLIVASAMYKRDGMTPEFWEGMKKATLETMPAEFKEAYLKTAPK